MKDDPSKETGEDYLDKKYVPCHKIQIGV